MNTNVHGVLAGLGMNQYGWRGVGSALLSTKKVDERGHYPIPACWIHREKQVPAGSKVLRYKFQFLNCIFLNKRGTNQMMYSCQFGTLSSLRKTEFPYYPFTSL